MSIGYIYELGFDEVTAERAWKLKGIAGYWVLAERFGACSLAGAFDPVEHRVGFETCVLVNSISS